MIPLLLLLAADPLTKMQAVMGEMPARMAGAPAVRLVEEVDLGFALRRQIAYEAEPGDFVPAYLFLPKAKGRLKAMLCLHQTTKIGKAEPAGMGPKTELHYALELARRGYVTLAPDYPNFGDYVYDPYAHGYVSATMKGIVNHMRAVDLLVSLPQVDARRIGVIGHSLGGHNSLFAAAFDKRLKVAVTSCGFTAFARYYGGNLTGWSHRGYMPRIAEVYGKDPARMPFDFVDVLAAIAPRALFVNAPLRDANFDVEGVRSTVAGFKGRIVAEYPDAEHRFPDEVRRRAYEFIDRVLR
jgi:dienelactone hydrolase